MIDHLLYGRFMFDFWVAASVFIITGFMDVLHATYTKAIGDEKPIAAANSGALIYVISAYAVIQYTQNWIYVLFMVAGSWVGTYLTVTRNKKKKLPPIRATIATARPRNEKAPKT